MTGPAASVVLVGAGGLGGPLASELVGAGLRLTIFDHDVVEPSNLHRQLQFLDGHVGTLKAVALAAQLGARAHPRAWSPQEVAAETTLIVDGSDDAATKFAVADWAMAHGLPYVIAGALGVDGSVFVGHPTQACYRCLFEAPPAEALSCAQAGVLGPAVGLVASVAAQACGALLTLGATAGGWHWTGTDLGHDRARGRWRQLYQRAGCPNHESDAPC